MRYLDWLIAATFLLAPSAMGDMAPPSQSKPVSKTVVQTAPGAAIYYYESSTDSKMRVKLKTSGKECIKTAYATYKEALEADEKRVVALPPVNGKKCTGRAEGGTRSARNFEKNESVSVIVTCGEAIADLKTFVNDARKCKIMMDNIRLVEAAQAKK